LYAWAGRAIDPDSVDPIVLAEGARATKTYGGALRLMASGFGPQASMLNRSLFESMAIAHWAHPHPDRAIELFKKHGRHSELLWGGATRSRRPSQPTRARSTPAQRRSARSSAACSESTGRTSGPRTGACTTSCPRSRSSGPEGAPRDMLWWFFRIAHRDNNQVLHSTALGLSADQSRRVDHQSHAGTDAAGAATEPGRLESRPRRASARVARLAPGPRADRGAARLRGRAVRARGDARPRWCSVLATRERARDRALRGRDAPLADGRFSAWVADWRSGTDETWRKLAVHVRRTYSRAEVLGAGERIISLLLSDVRRLLPALRSVNRR
jgi:hypothetical protein